LGETADFIPVLLAAFCLAEIVTCVRSNNKIIGRDFFTSNLLRDITFKNILLTRAL
jgi:hypothetical protein